MNYKMISELKAKQKEEYDKQAVLVARGELGYIPAPKSKYSKSCKLSVKHKVDFT